MDPRFRSAGRTDFVPQADEDFSDPPQWDPNNSVNRVDPYSSSMLYGGPPDNPIIGINDPRPQHPRVAADQLMNDMYYNKNSYEYEDPLRNAQEYYAGKTPDWMLHSQNALISALLGRR